MGVWCFLLTARFIFTAVYGSENCKCPYIYAIQSHFQLEKKARGVKLICNSLVVRSI